MARNRKNPSTSRVAPDPGPIEGIDNLPNPIGVNMTAMKDAEKFPGHGSVSASSMSMKTNNGDNPTIADAPFANGKDRRHFEGGPSGTDATPAKPGA